MPLPITYNFETQYRGDDFGGITFNLYDANDVPIDISGASALMQVRTNPISDDTILSWSSDDDEILLNGNQIVVSSKSGEEMDIEERDYFYDLQITYEDGVVQTLARGTFPVKNDITSSTR